MGVLLFSQRHALRRVSFCPLSVVLTPISWNLVSARFLRWIFKTIFIDLRERERERRGRERNISWLPPKCTQTWDRTRNPGVCPDWESNPHPVGVQDGAPANWATQARAPLDFSQKVKWLSNVSVSTRIITLIINKDSLSFIFSGFVKHLHILNFVSNHRFSNFYLMSIFFSTSYLRNYLWDYFYNYVMFQNSVHPKTMSQKTIERLI